MARSAKIKNPDLQFAIGLVVAILFGILGVAGVIPFGWASVLLAGAMVFGASALWRSHWLSSLGAVARCVIVLVFIAAYSAIAYPALNRLAQRAEAEPNGPVIQHGSDCASNVSGNGNKVNIDCSDKSKK
jgi:hypothetical protein